MSSGFGSNIKDQIVSSNRSRPRIVGSSSGYGQQLKKKQPSCLYSENASDRHQVRSPPRYAEANEPQRGKIKAFIDLDAIPDEYGDGDHVSANGQYGCRGERVAMHQSNVHEQQPSSLYQPQYSDGVRDAYQESSSNNYMTESKPGPISQAVRRGINIIPKMGTMRSMQPDPIMQRQSEQQPPNSSRRAPPPPLPADIPKSSGSRSSHNLVPDSPEDRERRRLVNQVRASAKPGNCSDSNTKSKSRGVYNIDKRNNDEDDDEWDDDDDYYDDGYNSYGNNDINRYSQYDYNGNSDYDADAGMPFNMLLLLLIGKRSFYQCKL